jgi:hypothetical protein
MALRNPQPLAGGLVIGGYYRLETVRDDEWFARSAGHALPVAILQPKDDLDENVEQARNARDVLSGSGLNVQYVEYEGERAMPDLVAITAAWKWLIAQPKKAWKK